METEAAFDAIRRKLEGAPRTRITSSFYDASSFGNFWISYTQKNERRSIVNERGKLIVTNGSPAGPLREVLVEHLNSADEAALLASIDAGSSELQRISHSEPARRTRLHRAPAHA